LLATFQTASSQYGEFFSFGYFSRKGATDKQIAEASFSITFYASGYKQPPASNDQKPGI